MYLKRITVTGFKSFANKTTLDLETGISAIVGPNGSGKSNIADAIRWALGEQNKSRLRLNDREEVVFNGSDKRAKASFAEVTLLFDNQDGAFPLDLTEVEISRRLYRSGETDYRLGGRSVRLADIQALMAEAGFGAGTYAVIGQGMIDSFLLSSPAERKLLFDEAAGIRGSELKREAALRKLTATAANLTRLRDIAAELEPRLATLQRSMAAASELQKLKNQLAELRSSYGAAMLTDNTERSIDLTRRCDELTLESDRLDHEIKAVQTSQAEQLAEAAQAEAAMAGQRVAHDQLEEQREQLTQQLADALGRVRALEEQQQRAHDLAATQRALYGELEKARARATELDEDLHDNRIAADRAAKALARTAGDVAAAQSELVALRQETADGTQQQYVSHALEVMKTIARQLDDDKTEVENIRLLVHKAGRLLSHASRTGEAELLRKLRDAQQFLEAAMTRRETATEHQTNITITMRSIEIDLSHQQAIVAQLAERVAAADQQHEASVADADELKELRRTSKVLEAGLARCKDDIAAARAQLQSAPSVVATARIAEEAGRLERLKGQRASTRRELEGAAAILASLAATRLEIEARLVEWQVAAAAVSNVTDLQATERTLNRLEAEVAARQAVEEATSVEHHEVSERYGQLTAQITDLEQAHSDLESVVVQLDGVIRVRFKDNFASLASHFSRYFVQLFHGGAASLELEEDEEGNYGIVIKANPKGKRAASLAAMSGGERALAGVALLAAILRVNPSPFVVLDEIDAALDEANSTRLADILEELQQHSQLIVITHNRQTMTAARVLFGVTMNDAHVSHLLSLQLEEATALAAR